MNEVIYDIEVYLRAYTMTQVLDNFNVLLI